MTVVIDPPYLPIATVLKMLDLPESTFHALRRAGKGPRVTPLGRRIGLTLEDFRAWIAARREDNEPSGSES